MGDDKNNTEGFNVSVNPEYSIDLSTYSINPNLGRQDKRTVIYDKNNASYQSSSIMMGYNKDGYVLGDGSFVSADELKDAIDNAISKYESGTMIVHKSTKKVLDVNSFINMLKKAQGALIIGDKSELVTNQDTRTVMVESADGRQVNKGILFLGNHGLKLGTGEYVSLDEFNKAINDYVAITPIKENNDPLNKEKKVVRVTKRYNNKATVWLAVLGSLTILLSGFSRKNVEKINVPDDVKSYIQSEKDLYFDVDGIVYEYEPLDQTLRRTTENLTLGGKLNIEDGKSFNTNSLETGVSKTIGEDFSKEAKYSGDYRITGFSIVNNGKVLNYIEDFNGLNNVTKLKDILDDTLSKNNLNFEDVQVKIHMGTNNDYTRLGWIDVTELINADTITEDQVNKFASKVGVDKGIINNFSGDFITMSNGVTLKIIDGNGNLLSNGSSVIGSDGKEYVINNLSLHTSVQENNDKFVNIIDNNEKEVNKELSWDIKNCNLALGIAPLLAGVALGLANKKRNENLQKEPLFFEFQNDKEYLKFKSDFEKTKANYENSSKFTQIFKKVFFRKRVDVMQKLSSEQSTLLYDNIMKHAGKDFAYGPNDRISIKDGKIFVIYNDDHYLDITDVVMPDIYSIGKDNEIVAEGHLR